MIPEKLNIATSNVLFGGMAVKEEAVGQANIADWIKKHYQLNIHYKFQFARTADYARDQLEENKRNPILELIGAHNPDLIVLNEVMPDLDDKIIPTLIEKNYQVVVGRTKHVPSPLTRATVIASRFKGEEIDFEIPGRAGGGSCGLSIQELGLIILGLHPSAFNKRIRQEQLEYTTQLVADLSTEKPEFQIIMAGDFNMGGEELDQYLKIFLCNDIHYRRFLTVHYLQVLIVQSGIG